MVGSLLPWIAAAFSLTLAYPWARWLLDVPYPLDEPRPRQPVLILLLTVGLSLGVLTWLMMGIAALSPAWVTFGAVTAAGLVASGAGWIVWRRRVRLRPAGMAEDAPLWPGWRVVLQWAWANPATAVAALVVIGLVGLVLLNAAFWPFLEDDSVTIYGPVSMRIAQTGQLDTVPSNRGAYDAYPLLVPLAFTYPHLAAGAPHEYAARWVVAVLAVGVAGAAYVLGRDLYDRETGLAAAFVVMTTPILTHWAASGYTDLPAGTCYTLAALFAWRLFTHPHPAYAVLTGIMAGLAVFTKNGAWLIVGSLAGWVVYTHWAARLIPGVDGRAIRPRHAGQMAGAFLVVAGPWYAHTWLTFGYLVPPTGWTDRADPSLARLIGPALTPGHFALSGAIGVIGLAVALVLAVREWGRTRRGPPPRLTLLLGFALPFLLVWWTAFSYDFRFLLMIWAFYAVAGAWWLLTLARRLPQRWRAGIRRGNIRRGNIRRALPVVLILLALPAARMAVDHKLELLRNPFMSDAERHRVQLGPRYDLAIWLRDRLASDAWALVNDYHIVYHLQQTHYYTTFRPSQDQDYVALFDYWVLRPSVALPGWASDETLRLIHESDGYRVYEVLMPHHRPEE